MLPRTFFKLKNLWLLLSWKSTQILSLSLLSHIKLIWRQSIDRFLIFKIQLHNVFHSIQRLMIPSMSFLLSELPRPSNTCLTFRTIQLCRYLISALLQMDSFIPNGILTCTQCLSILQHKRKLDMHSLSTRANFLLAYQIHTRELRIYFFKILISIIVILELSRNKVSTSLHQIRIDKNSTRLHSTS